MTNRSNKWIVRAFEKLRKEFGDACQNCGSKERLEFAHINDNGFYGRGRGRKERYYNIKNNKSDYKLLCHSCHKEYDRLETHVKN